MPNQLRITSISGLNGYAAPSGRQIASSSSTGWSRSELGELEDQPRLAEPGIADHVHRAEAARLHHVPMLVQQRELDVAAAQPRKPVPALGAEACDARADRVEPVNLDRLRLALELSLAERCGVHETFDQDRVSPG